MLPADSLSPIVVQPFSLSAEIIILIYHYTPELNDNMQYKACQSIWQVLHSISG